MSARHACDFSRATAQSNLATTALLDGRFARAAELFGRAVEAAEQATPRRRGAPCDCFVTAYLMAARASALIRIARLKMDATTLERRKAARAVAGGETDNDTFLEQSGLRDLEEVVRLAPEAWAILERRRVAGTLLHARPAEEAWLAVRRTFVTADAAAADEGAAVPHGAAGVGCLLLGYEAVLCLADVALLHMAASIKQMQLQIFAPLVPRAPGILQRQARAHFALLAGCVFSAPRGLQQRRTTGPQLCVFPVNAACIGVAGCEARVRVLRGCF